MAREFERKYAASAPILERMEAELGNFSRMQMETTYFDTPDGALSARRMTLRLRRENGKTVCTLKTPLPDGSREEWESDNLEALLSLGTPPVPAELPPVIPVCGARFTRLYRLLPTADGTAELALDRGVLTGGGRELPLFEVELELKSGSEEATAALAETLAARFGLTEEPRSKFCRAMLLAQGGPGSEPADGR